MQSLASPKSYQGLAPYYSLFFPAKEPFKEWAQRRLEGKTVLDLGCGTGEHLHVLQSVGCEAYGGDLSFEMLHHGQNPASTLQMRLPEIPFKSESTSTLLCLGNTLSHLPKRDQDLFFRRCWEVLADDGNLWVQAIHWEHHLTHKPSFPLIRANTYEFERWYEYFSESPAEFFQHPLLFHTKILKNKQSIQQESTPLYPFTLSSLLKKAADRGFAIQNIYSNFKEEIAQPNSPSHLFHFTKVPRKNHWSL